MRKFVLSLILIITCAELLSQNQGKYHWLSIGPVIYSAHASSGFGLGFGYEIKETHHFKFRLAYMEEFILWSDHDNDRFTDAGILYCHVFGKDWFRVTAGGGLGFLAGRKFLINENSLTSPYREEKIFTPAIPFELGMDFSTKSAGVGFLIFANINNNKSISGVMFRLIFGKIRDKNKGASMASS